jgi:hypothetical protein
VVWFEEGTGAKARVVQLWNLSGNLVDMPLRAEDAPCKSCLTDGEGSRSRPPVSKLPQEIVDDLLELLQKQRPCRSRISASTLPAYSLYAVTCEPSTQLQHNVSKTLSKSPFQAPDDWLQGF